MSTIDSNPTTESTPEEDTLVRVRDLKTYYGGDGVFDNKPVKAVDGVSFDIKRGETLGLVGESGCGKTTLGRTLIRLEQATAGEVSYNGTDATALSGKALKQWRRNVQMVFQDPDSSLNERMTVGEIVQEPLDVHDWPYLSVALTGADGREVAGDTVTAFDRDAHDRPDITVTVEDGATAVDIREEIPLEPERVDVTVESDRVRARVNTTKRRLRRARVRELLDTVGLQPEHYYRYPHQFSGGQKQRIGIARALALEPDFIILDEPVSALDASVQAKILNLLDDLQDEFDLTYLFIAHDLAVVEHICDRVAVMYLGNVMELGPANEVFDDPANPYTHSLLSAIPEPDPTADKQRITLRGTPPSPRDPPSGCAFSTRCPMKIRPEKYEDIDNDVWEAIETFRDVLRQRESRDTSVTQQVFELAGLSDPYEDIDDLVDEVFGALDIPSEVETHIGAAVEQIRAGESEAARAALREEFGSVCERERPGNHEVSETGRQSRCHRHQNDYEDPAEYLETHVLD
ncbi:oligopeptide/dipeptide ABC transporter ATP-binding protein [Salarchaeum sp. III]|uniref:ABC transporter ATP-binding protein n=1 Tax=Salarchaeum sp. III TaxID=3107927 RepID=UPI002EDA8B85